MTHEELVEKVATAIRDAMFGRSFLKIPVSTTKPAARLAITAVAEAIREPTAEMVKGLIYLWENTPVAELGSDPNEPIKAEWRAMLDASPLAPKEGGE